MALKGLTMPLFFVLGSKAVSPFGTLNTPTKKGMFLTLLSKLGVTNLKSFLVSYGIIVLEVTSKVYLVRSGICGRGRVNVINRWEDVCLCHVLSPGIGSYGG